MQIRITSRYLLAAAIVERRSEFGWDQVELAEKAGLSQSVISTLERGANKSPRASTLEKLESAMQWDEGTCERLLAAEEIDIYAAPFPKRSEESQLKNEFLQVLGALASTTVLDPIRNPEVYTVVRDFSLKMNKIETAGLSDEQKSSLFNAFTELAMGIYHIREK